MIKLILSILLVLSINLSFAQKYKLDNQWYTIGPDELPSPNSKSSSKGIGPIEFIRTTKLKKGLLFLIIQSRVFLFNSTVNCESPTLFSPIST